jgi:hypothetical protein
MVVVVVVVGLLVDYYVGYSSWVSVVICLMMEYNDGQSTVGYSLSLQEHQLG